jgi:hypothetical protein
MATADPLVSTASRRPGPRRLRLAGVAFAILAALFMLWRGPARSAAPGGSSDFSLIWMSTRAWWEGESPYTVEATDRVWADHAGMSGEPAPNERIPALLVYPPTTFPVLAPWCLADWPASRTLWAGAGVVLLFATVVLLLGLAGLAPGHASWWFAAGGMLLLAPVHATISVGQPIALVMFLIVLAQAFRRLDRALAAGIALGLAAAVKPQIGLPFLIYEGGRGRWRTFIMGVLTLGLAAGVGVWVLRSNGIDWLPAWRDNLRVFSTSDNGSSGLANPIRYQLVNLHVWIHAFLADTRTVGMIVWGVVLGLCGAYLAFDRLRPESRSELVSLSMVGAASLMIVYHRSYDAMVLLFPAALLAQRLVSGRRGVIEIALAACLGVFLVPGPTILDWLADKGKIPASIVQSPLWNGLLIPHAAITILVLAVVLVFLRRRAPHEAGSGSVSGLAP